MGQAMVGQQQLRLLRCLRRGPGRRRWQCTRHSAGRGAGAKGTLRVGPVGQSGRGRQERRVGLLQLLQLLLRQAPACPAMVHYSSGRSSPVALRGPVQGGQECLPRAGPQW